ncbi:MAG: hypothetical protein OXF02_03720 [Simkaniaceae bacterium]|nr:hypothetical protein [Simkaniaceae bacterium]
MKKINKGIISVVCLSLLCLGYSSPRTDDLPLLATKKFTVADSKRYLGRDLLSKGYQPLQIKIKNNSSRSYEFSLSRFSQTCADVSDVINAGRTNTTARATGYGVGALFVWPLAIPAIVDGIGSSQSNDVVARDYSEKSAKNINIIGPYSSFNKVVFIPISRYQNTFTLSLVDVDSQKILTFRAGT